MYYSIYFPSRRMVSSVFLNYITLLICAPFIFSKRSRLSHSCTIRSLPFLLGSGDTLCLLEAQNSVHCGLHHFDYSKTYYSSIGIGFPALKYYILKLRRLQYFNKILSSHIYLNSVIVPQSQISALKSIYRVRHKFRTHFKV